MSRVRRSRTSSSRARKRPLRRRFRLRWAAYPSWVRIATAAEALVVAVIVLVAWRLVWYSGGDESAFDSAFEFSTGSPQLERALLTSWTWATQGGAPRSIRSLDYWRPYIEPSLPPAL